MPLPNKLEPFFAKLQESSYFGVRIVDIDKADVLATNKTAAEMVSDSGSVNGYFNSLYERGVKNIVIRGRRKNGSSWINDGEPVQVGFEPAQPAPPGSTPPPTQPPAPPAQDFNIPGLQGGPLHGLAATVNYQYMDYPRVVGENMTLKAENAEQKKEIDKLKYEALENKFSEAKAAGSRDTLNGLMKMAGPILNGIMMAKMGGGVMPPTGLGMPPVDDASDAKQELMEAIVHAPENVCEYLYATIQGLSLSPGFAKEFADLLLKHELITNEDA